MVRLVDSRCESGTARIWKVIEQMFPSRAVKTTGSGSQKGKKQKRKRGYVFSSKYICSNEFVVIPGYGNSAAPYVTREKRCGFVQFREISHTAPVITDAASRRNILR